jgi:acyl-CoA thioester hydrolase
MQGFRHVTPIEIRFRDLDAFGHVNNAVIMTYIETARLRYLVDLELRAPRGGWNDIPFILARLECDFKKPIFYGQKVEVGSRVVELKNSSLRIQNRVEADGEVAAESYGVVVHYDYAAARSRPISPEMRIKIETFEQGGEISDVTTPPEQKE